MTFRNDDWTERFFRNQFPLPDTDWPSQSPKQVNTGYWDSELLAQLYSAPRTKTSPEDYFRDVKVYAADEATLRQTLWGEFRAAMANLWAIFFDPEADKKNFYSAYREICERWQK